MLYFLEFFLQIVHDRIINLSRSSIPSLSVVSPLCPPCRHFGVKENYRKGFSPMYIEISNAQLKPSQFRKK